MTTRRSFASGKLLAWAPSLLFILAGALAALLVAEAVLWPGWGSFGTEPVQEHAADPSEEEQPPADEDGDGTGSGESDVDDPPAEGDPGVGEVHSEGADADQPVNEPVDGGLDEGPAETGESGDGQGPETDQASADPESMTESREGDAPEDEASEESAPNNPASSDDSSAPTDAAPFRVVDPVARITAWLVGWGTVFALLGAGFALQLGVAPVSELRAKVARLEARLRDRERSAFSRPPTAPASSTSSRPGPRGISERAPERRALDGRALEGRALENSAPENNPGPVAPSRPGHPGSSAGSGPAPIPAVEPAPGDSAVARSLAETHAHLRSLASLPELGDFGESLADDLLAPLADRLEHLRRLEGDGAISEEERAGRRRRWAESELLPWLDLAMRQHTRGVLLGRRGDGAQRIGKAGESIASQIYERIGPACKDEGWFDLLEARVLETRFDGRLHHALGGRELAGARDLVVEVHSVGWRDADGRVVRRKAQVVVGK